MYIVYKRKFKEDTLPPNVYKVYHGTNNKFGKFSLEKATQGIIWFSDSIDDIKSGMAGAQGTSIIMTRYITLNNPAGWDEYEKYSLGQLKDMGYDGVILPDSSAGTKTFIVFHPRSISAKKPK